MSSTTDLPRRSFIALFIMLTLFAVAGRAQTSRSDESVRNLLTSFEQEEVDGLVKNDRAIIKKHWAPDYVVNNPFGQVVNASEGPIQAGTLTYSVFERNIQRIVVHGKTAIVMGSEKVVPKAPSPDAGKTIIRRFTNVWMKRNGKWLLTARQASVVCS